jgi:hypothetical protein
MVDDPVGLGCGRKNLAERCVQNYNPSQPLMGTYSTHALPTCFARVPARDAHAVLLIVDEPLLQAADNLAALRERGPAPALLCAVGRLDLGTDLAPVVRNDRVQMQGRCGIVAGDTTPVCWLKWCDQPLILEVRLEVRCADNNGHPGRVGGL